MGETGRSSSIVSDGNYKVGKKVYLDGPGKVKIEPAEISAEELAAQAKASEPEEPQGPTLQEIAEQEAKLIIGRAREQADEIRRQAREEGQAEGLKEGLAQGKAEGREESVTELRGTLDRWATMGDALTEAWRARFDGLEREIKDLSVTCAEKLVEKQLEIAPDTMLGLVREALRHAAEADLVTVLVSPADVAQVRAAREDLTSLLKGTGRFEVVEDQRIEAGGCLVETKTQVIDATRKTRVDALRDTINPKPHDHDRR